MNKYPAKFDSAKHVVVLKTYNMDDWWFSGVLPIIRRTVSTATIENPAGGTYTFKIHRTEKGEYGRIIQNKNRSAAASPPKHHKIVPYCPARPYRPVWEK